MLINNNYKILSKINNQIKPFKRFVLMRKYAYLREQLDEKLMEDKRQHQLELNISSSSLLKNKLKDNLKDHSKTGSKDNLILNSITSFKNLKEDVYRSLLNFEEDQGVKWKRFDGLNQILKGHRTGELTIFTGSTGSGKTTFLSEYSLDLCLQGVKTLWGNFELKNVVFLNKMLSQLAGKSIKDNIDEFNHWATEFEKLPIHFLTFHGEESFKNVLKTMEYCVLELGVQHVLIDNIQFMIGNQMLSNTNNKFDRFQYQDLVIGQCRKFATKYNCHLTLVIHPRKEQFNEDLTNMSIFGGGKATQEADNIMILQMKWLDSNRFVKNLQITKNRFDGDLGSFQLKFNKEHKGFGELINKNNEN